MYGTCVSVKVIPFAVLLYVFSILKSKERQDAICQFCASHDDVTYHFMKHWFTIFEKEKYS